MLIGADGAHAVRIGADDLEHRLGLLEATERACVGCVQHRLADRSVVGDLQQGTGEVTDVGR